MVGAHAVDFFGVGGARAFSKAGIVVVKRFPVGMAEPYAMLCFQSRDKPAPCAKPYYFIHRHFKYAFTWHEIA